MAYVRWLQEARLSREVAGGKGASLSDLTIAGFPVPPGFVVTTEGYRHFVEVSGLASRIAGLLAAVDPSDRAARVAAGTAIASLIGETLLPHDLADAVAEAYDSLVALSGLACAVRSSAVAEDGGGASFAGLYETYLNIRGAAGVLDSLRRCYVSLWSDRAVAYRAAGGDEAMAVVVMGLVPVETAGVAFTAHPVSGDRDVVLINAAWGLGEAVVSGRVTPDSFVVDKATLTLRERDIFAKELVIHADPDGLGTIEQTLPADKASAASLTDAQACAVAALALRVEAHCGCPQDIEWGLTGGQLFLLQARPITTLR